MSALIRDAVDRVMPDEDSPTAEERWARALAAIGTARGGRANASEEHDQDVADAIEDWRQK
jgi:hypothetical protein